MRKEHILNISVQNGKNAPQFLLKFSAPAKKRLAGHEVACYVAAHKKLLHCISESQERYQLRNIGPSYGNTSGRPQTPAR